MRILIMPSWYPTKDKPINGIFFREQAEALHRSGHEVIIAVFDQIWSLKHYITYRKNPRITKEVENGLIVYRFTGLNYLPKLHTLRKTIFARGFNALYRTIVKEYGVPDVIHAHSCLWGGYGAAAIKRTYGIPFILTEHSTKIGLKQIRSEYLPALNLALHAADSVITVSPSLKKELERFIDGKRITVIPNGIDMSRFSSKENCTGKNGRNLFRFFSLALLTGKKGMDTLLYAFLGIKEEAELYIGGDGEERKKLEELADRLGLSNKVFFLGPLERDEVIEQMNLCDAFVLASRYETFGVVYIEALACGKPVIATDCGGPSMIVNERNGCLVPVDEIEELEKAMKTMMHNYDTFDPVWIRHDCSARFSEEVVVQKIQQVYDNVQLKRGRDSNK